VLETLKRPDMQGSMALSDSSPFAKSSAVLCCDQPRWTHMCCDIGFRPRTLPLCVAYYHSTLLSSSTREQQSNPQK
jgi:hypothetical protein